jgi:apolipoprotein D and lipocalin family protein
VTQTAPRTDPGKLQGAARLGWVLALSLAVAGCAGQGGHPPLETVVHLDLARYQGTWYELARLPMWFQRHCLQSTATYALAPDGTVAVTNRCPTEDGTVKTATGTARVVDGASNARLEVVFDNWVSRLVPALVRGKYWVIHVDPDYRLAVVGHPDRKYLWILSRTAVVDEARYREAVSLAQERGFPVDRLLRLAPPPAAP